MLAEEFVILTNMDNEVSKDPSNYSTIRNILFQNNIWIKKTRYN
jgi:hypothetical protein